jgi:hypothetical protein
MYRIHAVNRWYCYRTLYPPFWIYARLLITLYISIKTYYLVFILLEIIRNIKKNNQYHRNTSFNIKYKLIFSLRTLPDFSWLYRISPDSTGLCLVIPGFRWWDHKPLLRIPVLVVGSWGSWFLLLVSFWSTADWSDYNCLFTTREVDQRG